MIRKQELGGGLCRTGTQISEEDALPSEPLRWHGRLVLEVWKEAGQSSCCHCCVMVAAFSPPSTACSWRTQQEARRNVVCRIPVLDLHSRA